MEPEPTRVEDAAPLDDGRDPVLRPYTWFVVAFALVLAGTATLFLSFLAADRALLTLAGWLIAAGNLLGGLGFGIASVQLLVWISPARPQFSLRSLLVAGVVVACLGAVGATWGRFGIAWVVGGGLQLLAPAIVVLASRPRPTMLQAGFAGAIVAVVTGFGIAALCGATIGAPVVMVGWRPPGLGTAFLAPASSLVVIGSLGLWPYCGVVVAVGALEGVICSKCHRPLREILRRKPPTPG